jgi:hypothetical protein
MLDTGTETEPPQEKPPPHLNRKILVGIGGIGAVLIAVILILSVILSPLVPRPEEDKGEDIGEPTLYWSLDTELPNIAAGDPINHNIAFRLKGGATLTADRVYVPSGNKLLALRPSDAKPAWYVEEDYLQIPVPYFETASEISADPISVNIGNQYDPDDGEFMVYVGTDDGTVYFIRESQEIHPTQTTSPFPEDVVEVFGQGSVTSLAVYSDPFPGNHPSERVFFGTSDGWLYAYCAGIAVLSRNEDTWVYDFASDEWVKGSSDGAPFQRIGHSLLYDSARDRVLLFGGEGFGTNTETWSLDPALNWRKVEAPFDPYSTPVDNPAVVYHEVADSILVFGGEGAVGDTSQLIMLNLSHLDWRSLSPFTSPGERSGHQMVYNSQDQIAFLFGTLSKIPSLDTTGLFSLDNNTWWFPGGVGPDRRLDHSMAYDSVNNRVVLFGGSNESQLFSDTWVFNFQNNSWIEVITNPTPSGRKDHSMAFDPSSGSVLLFGGQGDAGRFDDTWIFNVSTQRWQKMNPTTSPSGRFGHSITVDESTGKAVLFGGDDGIPGEIWKRKLGNSPIRMAGVPLQSPTDPNYSPAVNNNGTILVVNDGSLRAIWTQNGEDAWGERSDAPYIASGSVDIGGNWSSEPAVAMPKMYEDQFLDLTFVGSGDGWLYAFSTWDGTVLNHWKTMGTFNPNTLVHGIHLKKPSREYDDGALGRPVEFGSWIFVSSSSKLVYFLNVGESDFGNALWKVHTYGAVSGNIHFVRELRTLHFVDQTGRLYCLTDDGTIAYRVYLGTTQLTGISAWKDNSGLHPSPSVWVGGDDGLIYSYSASPE